MSTCVVWFVFLWLKDYITRFVLTYLNIDLFIFCNYYSSLLVSFFIFLSSNLLPISCRCCLPSCRYGGSTVGHTHWRAPPMWLRWGLGRDTHGPPPCWGLRAGERPLWASQGPCPGRQGSRVNSQHWTRLYKLYSYLMTLIIIVIKLANYTIIYNMFF